MSRIIIDNRSGKPDDHVCELVAAVIREGRVSNNNKQYCYVTKFGNGLLISADLNKKSDRFIAWREMK